MKKITVLVLILMLILSISSIAIGFEGDFSTFDNNEGQVAGVTNVVEKAGNSVVTMIRVISVTVALVMLLAVAMKYMLAAPGERADLKKHAVAYIVGAFLLFAVGGILSIIETFSKSITKGT